MPTIHLTETVLRDANQSLLATRLPLRQFEAVLETIDQAGYYSVECWGGATFDACLRYLDEDPWERLRILRKKMPRSRLQMLLRGAEYPGIFPLSRRCGTEVCGIFRKKWNRYYPDF